MSSPISGSGGPSFQVNPPDTFVPSSEETPFGEELNFDTLSSSSSVTSVSADETPFIDSVGLVEGDITIGQFSDAVLGQLNLSSQSIREAMAQYIDAARGLGIARADLGTTLISLAKLMSAANLQTIKYVENVNSNIDNMNTATGLWNANVAAGSAADQQHVDDLNTAIDQYNAGTINDTQFNAAVTIYNSYATIRNATVGSALTVYNSQVDIYNHSVDLNNTYLNDTLNPARVAEELPPLDPQTTFSGAQSPLATQDPAPLTKPVPHVTNTLSTESLIPTVPSPPGGSIQDVMGALLTAALGGLFAPKTPADVLEAGVETTVNNLKVDNPTIVAAFVQRIPAASVDSSASLQSGGVALSIISGEASGSPAAGAIQQNIYNAENSLYQLDLSTEGYQVIKSIAAQASSDIGLYSALPGLRLLGATGLTSSTSNTAFGVAFSVSYNDLASQYVASGAVEDAVNQFLQNQEDQGVEIADRQQAFDLITAEIKSDILQTALLVTEQNTGVPGLASQTYASAIGLSPADLDAAADLQTQNILQDTLKAAYLKATLSESLATSENIQADNAQAIINDAFAATLAQGAATTTEEFQSRFQSALEAQGIQNETAIALASQAADIINAEKSPQAFQNASLFNQEQVASTLAGQLSGLGYDASIASQAAASFFGTAIATNAVEYQISLQAELVRQGVSVDNAQTASAAVVSNLNSPAAALSSEELQSEYYTALLSGLTPAVGADNARSIADQGARSTQTITEQLNDIQSIRESYGVDTATQVAIEDYRNLQSPNIDLYTLTQNVMDPGKSLYLSAETGLMYASNAIPSNYDRTIDTKV